jgi:hypothetical protein
LKAIAAEVSSCRYADGDVSARQDQHAVTNGNGNSRVVHGSEKRPPKWDVVCERKFLLLRCPTQLH